MTFDERVQAIKCGTCGESLQPDSWAEHYIVVGSWPLLSRPGLPDEWGLGDETPRLVCRMVGDKS